MVDWCGDEDTDEKWAFRRARSSTGKSAEDMIAGWNTTAIDSFSCPYTFVGDEDKLMHGVVTVVSGVYRIPRLT
jgi:hypothetical protein